MKAKIWSRKSGSRAEIAAFEQLAHQNTQPDFDLIHPGRMLGRVANDHLVRRVMQERGTAFHRLEDPAFASSRPTFAARCLRARQSSAPMIRIDGC